MAKQFNPPTSSQPSPVPVAPVAPPVTPASVPQLTPPAPQPSPAPPTPPAPPVVTANAEDVETWATCEVRSATTRNNRPRTLSSAFAYAVAKRWCDTNPVSRVERATENKPAAGYLSAEQAVALLYNADVELRACVAIQLFAGLRPCEIAELKFESVNLERNFLVVDTEEHTTSHRYVDVTPNLHEWLLPYRSRTGKIQPRDYQRR